MAEKQMSSVDEGTQTRYGATASNQRAGMHPLEGVRVVELGQVAAGPFATMLLADMGADVVKVEPAQGDQMRQWPPLCRDGNGEPFSHNFASLNRNKRSVVANLSDGEQLSLVKELIHRADVVVENSRPRVLARRGLGFDEVSTNHKGLIYCSISGFGLRSPYADRGAYDVVVQGMSGLMSVTGKSDSEPVKCGVPVGDFVAGLYAAYTTASALPTVRASGESLHIDCPMLDCLLAISALQTSEYWGTGDTPRPLGSAHPRNAPYQAFQASDGMFTVAAGNDRLWLEVCHATGLAHLAKDERFSSQEDRAANQKELSALLGPVFDRHSVAYWVKELEQRGVPCGPIHTYEEILADDHVHRTGLVQEMGIPGAGTTPTVVYPARMSNRRETSQQPPPRLGEHTEQVLAEWKVRP